MAGVDCLYYSLSSSGFVFQLFYFGLNVDGRSKCYLIGMLKMVLACARLCTCVPNSYSQIKALFDVFRIGLISPRQKYVQMLR